MSAFSDLQNSLQALLERESCHFVIAYSGGVDSEALLHATHQLLAKFPQHQLSAIHVNHGLSGYADDWTEHCQRRCKALDINLYVVHVEVSGEDGVEAAAREARYQAFKDRLPANSIILLAQHQDDQLETMLLQLKRGAGPKGLASMPMQSAMGSGHLFVRPLLNVSKQSILSYALNSGLKWVEDDSNQNVRFERNFLRKEIIPSIKERWPQFAQSASRSAALCAEQQALLDEISDSHLDRLQSPKNTLDVAGLLAFSDQWIAQIIRYWLSRQTVRLPSKQIFEEIKKLLVASEDANPVVQWGEWQIRRFNNQLYLTGLVQEGVNSVINIASGAEHHLLNDSLRLVVIDRADADALCLGSESKDSLVEVHFDGFSRRFKPKGAPQTKPLKQWFKVWSLPPWERSRIPQIYLDGELVAVWVADNWIVSDTHQAQSGPYLQAVEVN